MEAYRRLGDHQLNGAAEEPVSLLPTHIIWSAEVSLKQSTHTEFLVCCSISGVPPAGAGGGVLKQRTVPQPKEGLARCLNIVEWCLHCSSPN